MLTFQVLQHIIPRISKFHKFTLTKLSIAFVGNISQFFINALHLAKLYTLLHLFSKIMVLSSETANTMVFLSNFN